MSISHTKPTPTTPYNNTTTAPFFPTDTNPNPEPEFEKEHASPTKALFATRLSRDITSLTTWLSKLFPHAIPPHLLKWRDEVVQSSLPDATITGILLPIGETVNGNRNGNGSKGSDVLEALKALRQANLLADHLRSLVHEARLEELGELERMEGVVEGQKQGAEVVSATGICVDGIWAGLNREGRGAVERLGGAAVVLGLNFTAQNVGEDGGGEERTKDDNGANLVSTFASRMLDQACRNLVLEEQVKELDMLQRIIVARLGESKVRPERGVREGQSKEARSGSSTHDAAEDDGEQHEAERMHAETAKFNRDTKQINLKILEYQDRVTGLERQLATLRADSVSLEDVLEARGRVDKRSKTVKDAEERISAFHGLPPDLAASREEVKRAMNELESLKRRREELFGRISSVER